MPPSKTTTRSRVAARKSRIYPQRIATLTQPCQPTPEVRDPPRGGPNTVRGGDVTPPVAAGRSSHARAVLPNCIPAGVARAGGAADHEGLLLGPRVRWV